MIQCLNPKCLHDNPPKSRHCQKCYTPVLRLKDRYCAVKHLSQGGFCSTFKAVDEDLFDRLCVMKQFLPKQGSNEIKARELFKEEAMRLRDLGTHPQIPELLAFFEQEGNFYLVQEFIDGEDLLKEFVQQGKFSERQIKQLLTELLPVLEFVHNNNVIHRDIKPDNIIRNQKGSLVLIDVEVSQQLSSSVLTRVGTVIPGYAAPEQMQGHVFPASDIYSLGVTCIRLLTGCFTEEKNGIWVDELFDPMQLQWIWREKNVSISNDLAKVLDKMLMFPVGARYQSATEVLEALNSVSVSPTPISVPPSPKLSEHQSFTEDLGNGVTLDMRAIPGGSFIMGAPETEAESRDYERPQHRVTIQPFFMGKYTVTQAQWKAVATLPKIERDLDPDPSNFKGDNLPVERVSWRDAIEFCARLSQKTGRNYRLPSEAEWEYACRAGTTTPFHFGQTITTDQVNYNGNYTYAEAPTGKYREQTTDVGSFLPNTFGLYDMHGNIYEWCADPWHAGYQGAPNDGRVWDEKDNDNRYQNSVDLLVKSANDGRNRLLRGGSWGLNPRDCRSAFREYMEPDIRDINLGFRLLCAIA